MVRAEFSFEPEEKLSASLFWHISQQGWPHSPLPFPKNKCIPASISEEETPLHNLRLKKARRPFRGFPQILLAWLGGGGSLFVSPKKVGRKEIFLLPLPDVIYADICIFPRILRRRMRPNFGVNTKGGGYKGTRMGNVPREARVLDRGRSSKNKH